MGMVRTNITLPAELLAQIDEVAGPRGRSGYIAEIVGRQARRDRARLVFEKYAGAPAA
jgi:metal-responsive CopG/Arc/MetJ family transcriptional regulator